jgi:hypothetical protein
MVWVFRGDKSRLNNDDPLTDIEAAIPVLDFNSRAGQDVANAYRDGREVHHATIGVPPDCALRTVALGVDGLDALINTTTDTPDHPLHPGVKQFVAAEWISHL